jgi:hypothetical protein
MFQNHAGPVCPEPEREKKQLVTLMESSSFSGVPQIDPIVGSDHMRHFGYILGEQLFATNLDQTEKYLPATQRHVVGKDA